MGDPLDEKTIVGPMISQAHLAKVRSYIELGPKEGATLLCGGLDAPSLPDRVKKGNYVMPTVFADVDNRMRIAQEEIFGPVACLIPFKDEADAIRLANDIQYGLSSYVWTENLGRAHRVAAAVEAGMCFVNSQNVRDLRQPFGGTKASGTGREGGTWSYEVFCEPKNVAVSLGSHHIPHWGAHEAMGIAMGKLALAAKITHVPSMYLSEFPGPNFGCREAAINGHKEIDRRCRALGVDTIVVFDVHWQVNSEYHINCGPKFEGIYTSNELPHFIKNMPYAYPGNPALGHMIGDMANAMGVKSRAHSDTTLELEYGTLVPMRYMNADQHYKVISISGWCDWHDLHESGRFGLAVRRAIEEKLRRHRGGVRQRLAVAPLRRQRPRARVHAQGLRPVPGAGGSPRGGAVEGGRLEDLHRHAAHVRGEMLGRRRHARHGHAAGPAGLGPVRGAGGDRDALLRQFRHGADQRGLSGHAAELIGI